MALTVIIDLSPETEAELRNSIADRDTDRVRQVLAEALTTTVEALLQPAAALPESDEEWDALADELINRFTAAAPAAAPILSDYAASRAGIYEEHP